jgi:hypothetical protein
MTLWNVCHNASAWEDVGDDASAAAPNNLFFSAAHDVDDRAVEQLHDGLHRLGAVRAHDVRAVQPQFPAASGVQTEADRQTVQDRDFGDGDLDHVRPQRRQKLDVFPFGEVHASPGVVLLSGKYGKVVGETERVVEEAGFLLRPKSALRAFQKEDVGNEHSRPLQADGRRHRQIRQHPEAVRGAGHVFQARGSRRQLSFAVFGLVEAQPHRPDDLGQVVRVDGQLDGAPQADLVHDGGHGGGKVTVEGSKDVSSTPSVAGTWCKGLAATTRKVSPTRSPF